MNQADSPKSDETPQDKREEKLRKKRARIKQHGKGLGQIYRDAVSKRGRAK